jgi:hypothetical protein
MDSSTAIEEDLLKYVAEEIEGYDRLNPDILDGVIRDSNKLSISLDNIVSGFEEEKELILSSEDRLEQQRLRESIVDSIEGRLGVSIGYPRLIKSESGELTIGAKVRIKEHSRFSDQNTGIGKILRKDTGDNGWVSVEFEDGYSNIYAPEDLKLESDDETYSKVNQRILNEMPIRLEDFREYLMRTIPPLLNKASKTNSHRTSGKFEPGDLIVMSKGANKRYYITKEGSEGKVIRGNGSRYTVLFTKLTDDYESDTQEYDVYAKDMVLRENLKDAIKKAGGKRRYIQKLIDDAVNEEIISRVKEKFKDKRIEILVDNLIEQGVIFRDNGELYVNQKRARRYGNGHDKRGANDNNSLSSAKMPSQKDFKPKYDELAKKGLFMSGNMNAPLAEQSSNVVQFEYTVGCSHNKCTYCNLYKGSRFHKKSLNDFKKHVDKVFGYLAETGEANGLTRVFIGGGDALSVETKELSSGIDHIISLFKKHTGNLPKRISMYGSVKNILEKDIKGLKYLHCGGTCSGTCSSERYERRIGLELVYLGMETGDSQLLKELNKGHTEEELYRAIAILNKVNTSGSHLDVSAFVMPGLGGERYNQSHVHSTLNALRALEPKFINLMTIKEHPGSAYAKWMDRAEQKGDNRRLTQAEIGIQIADFIAGIDFPTTIGCFDNSCYLGENTNAIHFPSVDIDGVGSQIILADKIRTAVHKQSKRDGANPAYVALS